VTGAGAGMGKEIAIEAARQGAEAIAIVDLNGEAGRDTASEVVAAGGTAHVFECDLGDSHAVTSMVESAAEAMGGLDTLVNNAGMIETGMAPDLSVSGVPEEIWDRVMNVNLKAVWLATKAAAPFLRRSDRGPSIMNAASVAGLTGYPMTAYSVSKAAVVQLTRVSAIDLAPEVRVNAFCPGSIETPMSQGHLAKAEDQVATKRAMTGTHLIPRFGTVDEVAKTVCFFVSDDASFLTGVILPVDGGTMAWRGVRPD